MEPTKQGESGGIIWIKGSVSLELGEGGFTAVEGVLIKTNQGAFAYTDERGEFRCPVCAPVEHYALCAFKQGFEVWVELRELEREGPGNEWDIILSPEPVEATRNLAMMLAPACIMPRVINRATKAPIPFAQIKLGNRPYQNTDSTGNSLPLCNTAGVDLQLCARKGSHYPERCKTVNLPAGETATPGDPTDCNDRAVICLDYVP
jgi:hypothetical protein